MSDAQPSQCEYGIFQRGHFQRSIPVKTFGKYWLIGAMTLGVGPVWAQPGPPGSSATQAPPGATATRTEGGRRVYVASTTIEVRGEIQRPYAFSVSGRSSLGYTYFDQPIQFLQLILDAVRRAPF